MSDLVSLPDWPLFGLSDDIRPALSEVAERGDRAVVATLHGVVGGSPRPPGSQMLIAHDRLSGFMSGGCIEGDIAVHAAEVMDGGRPQRLVYGDGGPNPDIRLVCGGRVEILLERVGPGDGAVWRLLTLAKERRQALWVGDGWSRTCWAADEPTPALPAGLAKAATALTGAVDRRCISVDEGAAIGLRFDPARRMIVVGSDPTAMAIASLAAQTGFETWLVRPKGPEAPPPLAGVNYDRRMPDVALAAIGVDRWTHVAVATHDLESDEAALKAALASNAGFIGVLGARRRLPERLARLRAAGVSESALARLRAPIGLDLGGKAPFEIAIAVLAEAIAFGGAGRLNGATSSLERTLQPVSA